MRAVFCTVLVGVVPLALPLHRHVGCSFSGRSRQAAQMLCRSAMHVANLFFHRFYKFISKVQVVIPTIGTREKGDKKTPKAQS